jgi:riboflavin synthase
MFTGIVEAKGKVTQVTPRLVEIASDIHDLETGESIAVNGVCLTVTRASDGIFAADISEETYKRTNLGRLPEGSVVNLERALEVGRRLGGHMVQGHVDGICTVASVRRTEGSVEMWLEAPQELRRYLAKKGSVAVDGVSLTVSGLSEDGFSVALIPFTLEATNLGSKQPGDEVNIEIDILAKYVERLTGSGMVDGTTQSQMDLGGKA